MISFVPVKLKVGHVRMKIVEEGSEAWNLSSLEYTRREQWAVIQMGDHIGRRLGKHDLVLWARLKYIKLVRSRIRGL